MSTNLIILLSVIALLVIIGASQRKKLVLFFRSEVSDFVEKNTNTIKVAKLKVKDLKNELKDVVDQAAELFAEEKQQNDQATELLNNYDKLMKEAKKAKEDDNPELAKEKLRLAIETEKQINLLKENVSTMEKKRASLEATVQRIKNYITTSSIQVKGIAARQKVNALVKKTSASLSGDSELGDIIESTTLDVEKEELKLEYTSEPEKIAESDAVVDEAFEKL